MANLQKKLTQENAPDLAQKLLLRDIKPDLDNFSGCYFGKFTVSQKLFGIFQVCLKCEKVFFSNKILKRFAWPKGCTEKKILMFENAFNLRGFGANNFNFSPNV